MIFIGIDVAKSKHDCCIIDSSGSIIIDSLRIANSKDGFDALYHAIISALHCSRFFTSALYVLDIDTLLPFFISIYCSAINIFLTFSLFII